jgi:WD40 repeat protein
MNLLVPQYWIIDALDECVKYSELFSLLKSTPIFFPLRIFITSRKLADMAKLLTRQLDGATVRIIDIPKQNTMEDIELYVSNRISDLAVDGEKERDELKSQIILKSNASFLWVRLVMDELEGLYGYESMLQVLQGIPEEMVSYYGRAIAEMAEKKREKHIAKAILRWVALANHPLNTSELSQALEVDIKTRLSNLKSATEGLCGHLVVVEDGDNSVRLIHTTAREFLFSEDAAEFRVSKSEGHKHIALACLNILCDSDMQPPRKNHFLDHSQRRKTPTGLLKYAISNFSEHVFHASAKNNNLLTAVDNFLSTNVTTWIEEIASTGDVHHLLRASRNLKAYIDRRSKYESPLNRQLRNVDSWATDLGRLGTKFGRALAACPRSIHFLLPPFFPEKAAASQQFRRSPDSLSVVGLKLQQWDDCISSVSFGEQATTALSCGYEHFAVGFESGDIGLYNCTSYEKISIFQSQLYVDLIHFDTESNFIVTTNRKFMTLWDVQGTMHWKVRLRSKCIKIKCSSTFIFGITQSGRSFRWNIEDGTVLDEHHFPYQSPGGLAGSHEHKAPSAATISPDFDLVAVSYRNSPVCLYEVKRNEAIAWAINKNGGNPEQFLFNPNPDISLLLVASTESHLSLYDSWTGKLLQERAPEGQAIFSSLASSPSGHTFATVDVRGSLRIWDFESLTVLYHVVTPSSSFRLLKFTLDGFSLLDMTGSEMKVWSPSALLRKTVEEEASTSDQPEGLAITEGQYEDFRSSKITAITAHRFEFAAFVGKHNGDVARFNLSSGEQTDVLYSHQHTVNHLLTCNKRLVASSDLFNIVQVWSLISMAKAACLLELKFPTLVRQLLFDEQGEHLLISTSTTDFVYSVDTGQIVGSINWEEDQRTIGKWTFITIEDEGHFALVHDHNLQGYCPSTFPQKSALGHIPLEYEVENGYIETEIHTAIFDPASMLLVLEICQRSGHLFNTMIRIFELHLGKNPSSFSVLPADSIQLESMKHFLGINNGRFTFLSKSSWVCSIPVSSGPMQQFMRHFFVPSDFTTASNRILPTIGMNGAFLFCLHDKLAVVGNGMKSQEVLSL